MRCLRVILLVLILSSCGHVPLTSLPKLKQLNLMTLDVQQLRVAVEMPDGLEVRQGSAIIRTGLRETDTEPALEERIVLQPVQLDDAIKATANLSPRAEVFRIAATDTARVEVLRAAVRQRKKQDPDSASGFLTVTSAACRSAPLPPGPLLVSTKLKTAADETYFVLTRNVDLRAIIPAARLKTDIPVCSP